MISPSESVVERVAPVRLLGGALHGARKVSRLEFHPAERIWTESAAAAEVAFDAVDSETELQEEMAAMDARLEQQVQQMQIQVEAARREARAEAREEWEEELEERVAVERTRVLRVCEEFERERARYFAGVEAEVVRLALAIAARVLHREVKLDPLMLAGVVRVALDRVAEDSGAVLRVPAAEMESWRGAFATGAEAAVRLMGDERLVAGECVLETNVGKVEFGVSAQLEEIEKGFFDLLQQRPA
ncbi:MAG: Flagellar assembly protein FliH/Type secretion system HrpE [Edaphobacter sp.]|nr:Flagellar assembly protein FliH/Type secretion system HrpE [Edaphobacter sp.]